MTNAERQRMRMRILKDALAVIQKPGVQVAQENGYVNIESERGYWQRSDEFREWVKQNEPFHTDLLKGAKETTCSVCALGSLFLADVDRRNKVTVYQAVEQSDRDVIVERLGEFFSPAELTAIECVFENNEDARYHDARDEDLDSDQAPVEVPIYAKKLQQAVGRLRNRPRLEAMLRFLIANKGVVE